MNVLIYLEISRQYSPDYLTPLDKTDQSNDAEEWLFPFHQLRSMRYCPYTP